MAQKRAEYQVELQEALRAVARIQGAIIAVDELLVSGRDAGALPDIPNPETPAS